MALRPFISNLYEVITVDMDYFFMYGNDINYVATKNINEDLSDSMKNTKSQELYFKKGKIH